MNTNKGGVSCYRKRRTHENFQNKIRVLKQEC